jgi:HlyD family secretion protein
LASRENVLRVPASALRYKPAVTPERSAASRPASRSASRPEGAGRGNGRSGSTVFVLENGKPKPVRVKLGISDGRFTEILGGDLKEGDALITEEVTAGGKAKATDMRVPGPRVF